MESRIKTIHHDLTSGNRSCFDMVQEKLSLLNANMYHTVHLLLEESALKQAKQVDEKVRSGKPVGQLEGVPFGITDVLLLQNTLTTGGTAFLKNYHAPYTATAIQKLMDAGAIPLVKEGCSAVNVAKGHTAFSIGSDIGGCIRQPAGYHQLYGMKPTYGRVSRYGMMANMSSIDCIGTLASSLEDIRILLNTMSGKDPNDPTTHSTSIVSENVFDDGYLKKEIVVGYFKNFIANDFLDEAIKNGFQKMLDTLAAKGIKIIPLDFFDVNVLVSVFYVLAMAEEASNLARFDGTLYGERAKSSSREDYTRTRAENFSKETINRIIGGNLAVSRSNYEDIYLKARRLRNEMIDCFNTCFKKVDVILSPVTASGIAGIDAGITGIIGGTTGIIGGTNTCGDRACPVSTISDAFTAGFSLGGLPTLAVPFFTPTGIQISSNKNQEDMILNFAHVLKEIQ